MLNARTKSFADMKQDEIDEMCERDMAWLAAEAQSDYEPKPWDLTREEERAIFERACAAKARLRAAELRRVADELDAFADTLVGKPVPADVPQPMPYDALR
jgi:hypothetical protein